MKQFPTVIKSLRWDPFGLRDYSLIVYFVCSEKIDQIRQIRCGCEKEGVHAVRIGARSIDHRWRLVFRAGLRVGIRRDSPATMLQVPRT